jgi:hypothetical protein
MARVRYRLCPIGVVRTGSAEYDWEWTSWCHSERPMANVLKVAASNLQTQTRSRCQALFEACW